MAALVLVLFSFVNRLRRAQHDPEFRAIELTLAVLLAVGTVFYSNIEGWSVLDALYFSVITLATVGYGDLAPRTAAGKIFTMVYVMLGIGLILTFGERLVRGRSRLRGHAGDAKQGETSGRPRE
jgi:hypothetical protein